MNSERREGLERLPQREMALEVCRGGRALGGAIDLEVWIQEHQ